MTYLTTARAGTHGYAKRRHAGIMVRFEEVLAEHLSRPLQMPELCALVAVSDQTLLVLCRFSRHEPDPVCAVASVEGSPPRAA